jgi:Uma2 family endonuclease
MVDYERRPISIEDFHRMAEAGIFGDDERVELIDGDLIVSPQMGPRHAGGIERINEVLVLRLAGIARVRCQVPLPMLPRSEPSPDFTIVPRDERYHVDHHPGPGDVLWVIELGDATRAFDRNKKFPLYARHGVRETWLIDLVDRRVIVGRHPLDTGYGDITTLCAGTLLRAQALPEIAFTTDELLGAERR